MLTAALLIFGCTHPSKSAQNTDELWFSCGWEADGLGHEILADHGARRENAEAISFYAHGVSDPRTPGEELLLDQSERAIWVNAEGERFMNEADSNHYISGDIVLEQTDQIAWTVFDAATRDSMTASTRCS